MFSGVPSNTVLLSPTSTHTGLQQALREGRVRVAVEEGLEVDCVAGGTGLLLVDERSLLLGEQTDTHRRLTALRKVGQYGRRAVVAVCSAAGDPHELLWLAYSKFDTGGLVVRSMAEAARFIIQLTQTQGRGLPPVGMGEATPVDSLAAIRGVGSSTASQQLSAHGTLAGVARAQASGRVGSFLDHGLS